MHGVEEKHSDGANGTRQPTHKKNNTPHERDMNSKKKNENEGTSSHIVR